MLSIQAKKGNTLNPMPRALRYNGFCTLNPTYALEFCRGADGDCGSPRSACLMGEAGADGGCSARSGTAEDLQGFGGEEI